MPRGGGDQVDGDIVGLAVLNPTGAFFNRRVERHDGDHSDTPGAPDVPSYHGGTWHWPARV